MRDRIFIHIISLSLIILACAEDGDDNNKKANYSQSSGVNQGLDEIRGTVRVNALGVQNFVMRLYDLESNKFIDTKTSAEGKFSLSISLLSQGRSYAFHVLDNKNRRIGILDFSNEAGLQGAIIYGGGFGFDTGFIDIVTTSFGLVTSYDFEKSLAGDFTIDTQNSGELTDSGLADYISSVSFGRELVIGNSVELYNMFVKRGQNLGEYTRGLRKYGGAFISVFPADGVELERLYSGRVYDWFRFSRVRLNPFDNPQEGLIWSKTGYDLVSVDGVIDYSIATNSYNISGGYYSFGVQKGGDEFFELNRFLGAAVVRPPLLSDIDSGDGNNTAIDGTNNSDGLLSLLQITGTDNAVLIFYRPAYSEDYGTSETSVLDFDNLSLVFEYYNNQTKVEPSNNDFGSTYYTDQDSLTLSKTQGEYSWDISRKYLTRLDSVNNQDSDCLNNTPLDCLDTIEIPRELFLENNNQINRVKVNVIYTGSIVRSGSSYWFKN